MILLWGPEHDAPLRAVRGALSLTPANWLYVPEGRIADVRIVDETLHLGGTSVAFADIRASYIRSCGPSDSTDRVAALHAAAAQAEIFAWADVAEALVVNRPLAMRSNDSKPSQLLSIANFGLEVPRTLVTTDPDAVQAFRREVGEVIYKSISGQRSIVSRLAQDDGRLEAVRNCPTQFQQYVSGVDVRVHVVGTRTFVSEIISAADDYRYAGRQNLEAIIRPATIPDDLAERCVEVTRSLGLLLSGIDFRRTTDGRFVCFEVNTSPAFSFFDEDRAIAGAVADLLRAS